MGLFLSALTGGSLLADIRFEPAPDSYFIDVQADGGARGDGVTDDTEALRAILQSGKNPDRGLGRHPDFGTARSVYFPDGTYLVSEPIFWGDKKKTVFGESRDGVVIKLKDHAPAFQDPDNPVPVFDTRGKQFFAQNFEQRMLNMTIDVGTGNPGAIGLEYHTNNVGGIRAITIRSSDPERAGHAGLSMIRGPGPGLVWDLRVEGFRRGIQLAADLHSMTLGHIRLSGQTEVAIHNEDQSAFFSHVTSINRVPVIHNAGDSGFLSLVKGDFRTPDGKPVAATAVINPGNARLLLRHIHAPHYARVVETRRERVMSGPVEAFAWPETFRLHRRTTEPVSLPPELPPEVDLGDPADWVRVPAGGDFTEALQAAIDDGAEVIQLYNPPGKPAHLTDTVILRNRLRALIGPVGFRSEGFDGITEEPGYHDFRNPDSPGPSGRAKPLFRLADGEAEVVLLAWLADNYGEANWSFDHASTRTWILEGTGGSYKNTVPGGRVFMLDVGGVPHHFHGQRVWGWQLNPESYYWTPMILNDRSVAWFTGVKTEKDRTVITTRNGGWTELNGGFLYKNRERVGQAPAFVVEEGSNGAFSYKAVAVPYEVQVVATRDGRSDEISVRQTDGNAALVEAYRLPPSSTRP
ncbi:MAG: glycosyl hydrolase family 28-related protein [Opitutales bacterium]